MNSPSIYKIAAAALLLAASGLGVSPVSAQETYGQPQGNAQFGQLPPLQQLVAPVALYPDPVLSLLLPAAAYPSDIQSASAYLASGGDPNGVDSQSWDNAVKGLAHYPDVIRWMSDNSDWTQQLGGAFADNPDRVMDAVQDLRRRALDAGTLHSTDQIQVVQLNGIIEILPTQTDVIYIPRYNPDAVYFGGPDAYLTWGSGFPAGVWLSFDFDWRTHHVWTGDWFGYARRHGGWRADASIEAAQGQVSSEVQNSQQWQAPRNAPQAPNLTANVSGSAQIRHPKAMSGGPNANQQNQQNQAPNPSNPNQQQYQNPEQYRSQNRTPSSQQPQQNFTPQQQQQYQPQQTPGGRQNGQGERHGRYEQQNQESNTQGQTPTPNQPAPSVQGSSGGYQQESTPGMNPPTHGNANPPAQAPAYGERSQPPPSQAPAYGERNQTPPQSQGERQGQYLQRSAPSGSGQSQQPEQNASPRSSNSKGSNSSQSSQGQGELRRRNSSNGGGQGTSGQ